MPATMMMRIGCPRQSVLITVTLATLLIVSLPCGSSFSNSLSPLRTRSTILVQPRHRDSSTSSAVVLASEYLSNAGVRLAAVSGDERTRDNDSLPSPSAKKRRLSKLVSTALVIVAIGAWKRTVLLAAFEAFNPSHLNDFLILKLDKLSDTGNTGLVIYTVFFILWTMTAGITTPVETAAGLAFGVRNGLLCNIIGKTGGAILSFLLGRHFLSTYVNRKLKHNELLQLVDESIEDNPIGVSLMVRFAPLPEFVKNFGLSVLNVKVRYFILAVVVHGIPFTCLWTCLGAETARVMRGGIPSTTMKMLLSGVTWFGKFRRFCYCC
jgi:uncharacterized membrane protein YdjX (TVP38/TMEM64 family)